MPRIAVIGLGQAATHFAIGLERLKAGEIQPYGVPLANMDLGVGFDELEIVGFLEVDNRKIGKTVSEVARKFYGFKKVPGRLSGVRVYRGLGSAWVRDLFPVSEEEWPSQLEEVYRTLKLLRPDIIFDVSTTQYSRPYKDMAKLEKDVYAGKAAPSQVYAYLALRLAEEEGPLALVNFNPTPVANSQAILSAAAERGMLVFGDDGATGATPLTADILEHLRERNRKVRGVAQFNIGGNTDFLSLLEESRNRAKEYTKSSIVMDVLGYDVPHYIRPTGFLESLGDKKFVAMHIEYESFNGAVDEIIVNMRVNDSPALAGLMVDLARVSWLLLSNGFSGTVRQVNSFYMKRPAPPGTRSQSRVIAYQNLVHMLESIRKPVSRGIPEVGQHP